jgi:hypothetical protein
MCMKKALLIVALLILRLQAHDVTWTDNPNGIPGDLFPLVAPLTIYYRLGNAQIATIFPPSGEFDVAPTRDEPCVVEVQLDKPESQLLKYVNPAPTPANEVVVTLQLTALPLTTNVIETIVSGRWRALTNQGPDCSATNWTEFEVPVDIAPAPPWKAWFDPVLGKFNVETGGLKVGFREWCSVSEPSKVIAYGTTLNVDSGMRKGTRFFSGSVTRIANVYGTLKDISGNPLKDWKIGLEEGGITATADARGAYQLDPLPNGINNIRGWATLPYKDPKTGTPRGQYVGVMFPLASIKRYENFNATLNAQVFPPADSVYVPWLAIGYGSFDGAKPVIYYAGGVGAPDGTSRTDSGLQLWRIDPKGVGIEIRPGPSEDNVKENPEPGIWMLKGQLPNQPSFSLGINYKF